MYHRTTIAFALSLLLGCTNESQQPDDDTDGDTDDCVDSTETLTTDTAIVALTHTEDGTLWAMGGSHGWWADSGTGWEPVDDLSGTGAWEITSEGSDIWVGGQWGVFYSDGMAWTEVPTGLPDDGSVVDIAGLGDGRVALISNEWIDDGNGAHVRLHAGNAGGITTTDLGWIADAGRAVGGDGAGRALAVGEVGGAWLLEEDTWTEVTLPVEAYWTDVIGFDGRWVLVSSDGTVLRGSPGNWETEEVAVNMPRLAGVAEDELWIAGSVSALEYETGVIWHDQGQGWSPVAGPESALYAAVAPSAGTLVVGGEGPSIGRGDADGVGVEWTASYLVGGGEAWSAPDGRVFLATFHGQFVVDDAGTWTTLGSIGDGGSDIEIDGCETTVFAMSGEGELVTWDGVTLEHYDLPVEENTQYNDLNVTPDCVPVVVGKRTGEGEVDTPVALYLSNEDWVDLPTPPGSYANHVLAISPSDLLVATNEGLYRGDGEAWSAVSGTTDDVKDLVRTSDGRIWVSIKNAGLHELVADALVPVSGSPTRVDHLLPQGDALLCMEWSNDIGTVHRWDGAWETITTTDDVSALMALEGESYLLILTWDELIRICLDNPGR